MSNIGLAVQMHWLQISLMRNTSYPLSSFNLSFLLPRGLMITVCRTHGPESDTFNLSHLFFWNTAEIHARFLSSTLCTAIVVLRIFPLVSNVWTAKQLVEDPHRYKTRTPRLYLLKVWWVSHETRGGIHAQCYCVHTKSRAFHVTLHPAPRDATSPQSGKHPLGRLSEHSHQTLHIKRRFEDVAASWQDFVRDRWQPIEHNATSSVSWCDLSALTLIQGNGGYKVGLHQCWGLGPVYSNNTNWWVKWYNRATDF